MDDSRRVIVRDHLIKLMPIQRRPVLVAPVASSGPMSTMMRSGSNKRWARAKESGGTELGLPIVKEIVDPHDGRVAVTSQVNKR
jgi:hypothetical protein